MRRWGLWLVLLVTLGLSLPRLIACTEHLETPHANAEDDDDIWEDIEDDEVPTGISSKSRVSQTALVQLNDQNAEKVLKSNEYVMLLGYASWCRQSAAVMVDYAEAALTLKAKGNPVVLARIDAIVNAVTAGRYKIKGFPTVLFFRNGSGEIYPGGLSSEEIVNWIQKQTGHPTTTISSEEEAKEILRRKQTAVVVGYFEKFQGSEYEDFVAASMEVADVEFVQTTVAEAAGFFKPEMVKKVPSIGLFDSEDGFEQMDGPLTKVSIVSFANLYKYPMVTKLHSQNVGKVYSSPMKKQVILFASEDDFEDIYDFYRSAALTFKNRLMFVWVDMADEDFAKPMLTMYGIPDNEAVVAGFDNSNGLRYLMDAEVTKENLLAWSEKYFQGQLDLHYKSERIPTEKEVDVRKVVGKTFSSIVLERSTDLVLLVYTPYCYDCESMGKVFPKLAKHFKGNSSLIFGKIDASVNEHPALKVANYPAILFYPADSGSEEPVVGPSKPYLKKLMKFVEEQLQLRSSAENDLSNKVETREALDAYDAGSASLIRNDAGSLKVTDSESETTKIASEVPLSEGMVADIPVSVSKGEESVKVPDSQDAVSEVSRPTATEADIAFGTAPDSQDGPAEAVSEVSLPTATEVDIAFGTEEPVVLTVSAEETVAASSETRDIPVEEGMDVKDTSKDDLTGATVAGSSKTDTRAVQEDGDEEDLSRDVEAEASVPDPSTIWRRAVKGNREVDDLIKDEL